MPLLYYIGTMATHNYHNNEITTTVDCCIKFNDTHNARYIIVGHIYNLTVGRYTPSQSTNIRKKSEKYHNLDNIHIATMITNH